MLEEDSILILILIRRNATKGTMLHKNLMKYIMVFDLTWLSTRSWKDEPRRRSLVWKTLVFVQSCYDVVLKQLTGIQMFDRFQIFHFLCLPMKVI